MIFSQHENKRSVSRQHSKDVNFTTPSTHSARDSVTNTSSKVKELIEEDYNLAPAHPPKVVRAKVHKDCTHVKATMLEKKASSVQNCFPEVSREEK